MVIDAVMVEGVRVPVKFSKLPEGDLGYYRYRTGPEIEIADDLNDHAAAQAILHEALEALIDFREINIDHPTLRAFEMFVTAFAGAPENAPVMLNLMKGNA